MTRRLLTLLSLLIWSSPLVAQPNSQDKSAQQQRDAIVAAVRAYVDATNRGDVDAVVSTLSRHPNASSVSVGIITRGWEALRAQSDSLAGSEGSMRVSLGSIDVTPLGAAHALVVTGITITVQTPQGPVQLRGAWSAVLERVAGNWKVLHDHTSLPIE